MESGCPRAIFLLVEFVMMVGQWSPQSVWFVLIKASFVFDLHSASKHRRYAKVGNSLNFLKLPVLDSEASSALQAAHASDNKLQVSLFFVGFISCFRSASFVDCHW